MPKRYHIAQNTMFEAVGLAFKKVYVPSSVQEKTITVKGGALKTSSSLKRSSPQNATIARTTKTKEK